MRHPRMWRSRAKQLICDDSAKGQYLTDLSGENIEFLKERIDSPIVYLPEFDELIYMHIGFGIFPRLDPEKGYLRIYDFASGKSKMLCDDVMIDMGNAAYYKE